MYSLDDSGLDERSGTKFQALLYDQRQVLASAESVSIRFSFGQPQIRMDE
jgi:hypothetical protein